MTDPRLVERLRKARTELTQSELADKLGMSISTYRRMVEGSTPVTIDMVQRIANFFRIPEAMLLNKTSLFDDPATVDGADYDNPDTWIMVRLDGSQKTLDGWIKKLTRINGTI